MKKNLTIGERDAETNKVLCVAQPDGLWTVYHEGDEQPGEPVNPIDVFSQACTAGLQGMLDAKAMGKEYASIHTAAGWAGELPDATVLKQWGAACWRKAGEIRADVLAGVRSRPGSVEEFLAEMPDYSGFVVPQ